MILRPRSWRRPLSAWVGAAVLVAGARTARAADIKVACVGDSITAGSGASNAATTAYPPVLDGILGSGWNAQNFGNSGKTMIKMPSDGASYWAQTEFTQSQTFAPDIVVIMLGTNDSKTTNWKSGNNTYAADYKSMVNVYLGLSSRPKVYAMLPIPALKTSYNITPDVIQKEIIPIIQDVAKQTGIGVIDLNSAFAANNPMGMLGTDGIHPNDQGYRFIAQTVADFLRGQSSGRDGGSDGARSTDSSASDGGRDAARESDAGHTNPSDGGMADALANAIDAPVTPPVDDAAAVVSPDAELALPDGARVDPERPSTVDAGGHEALVDSGTPTPMQGESDAGCSCRIEGGRAASANWPRAAWMFGGALFVVLSRVLPHRKGVRHHLRHRRSPHPQRPRHRTTRW